MLFKFRIKSFESGESVSCSTRESSQHLILVETSDFPGIAFHNSVAQCHLAIATDADLITTTDRDDRCSVELLHIYSLRTSAL